MLLGDSFAALITRAIVVLIAMTIHEFAHSYAAYLAGDPTAANQGRLTLNPLVHIHWLGFAMFVLVGFGILGSAPVNPNRMRNPRWGHLFAVAAGPLSNLLLAVIVALLIRIAGVGYTFPVRSQLLPTTAEIAGAFIFWNVLLFVFNILPFFPIDGWHIVRNLLPLPSRKSWEKNAQTSQYILLGLILWSFVSRPGQFNPLVELIFKPTRSIINILV